MKSTPALLTQTSSPPFAAASDAIALQAASLLTSRVDEEAPFADLGRGFGGRGRVDVGRPDAEAAPPKFQRDLPPKAASRSGDDGRSHSASSICGECGDRGLPSSRRAERPRGERKPLEESPDTEGHGGG